MHPAHVDNAEIPSGTPTDSGTLYLPLLAVAVVVLVTLASLLWSHDHPYGFNWDESLYINEMHTDISHFHAGGIPRLIKAWLAGDTLRPPAYRILAFPFAALFGPSPFVLRAVAILFRLLTFWLLFVGVASIAGRKTAALAVILLALCPDIIFFSTVFYNEYALYLATAGTCCFVFRNWNQAKDSLGNCLGLGVSLGIGALAKASFPVLAGCFLLLVVFFRLCKKIAGPSPQFVVNACVVGELMAAPWWLLNFRSALHYVGYAMDFSRHAMGYPGIGTTFRFLLGFLQAGFGLPIGCLCIAVLIVVLVSHLRTRPARASNASSLAVICVLLAPLPTCVMPLFTHNQMIYHISQSLILFACGFALLAKSEGWLSSSIRFLILNIAIFAQLGLTLAPVVLHLKYPGQMFAWTVLARWEQWDWNEFRVRLRAQGLEQPSIAYLGGVSTLNPPQIVYPWLSHHEPPPEVTWLWRIENGTPDVPKLVATASTNDVVFAVPDLTTADWNVEQPDNQYNTDFAKCMSNSPAFQKPLHLRLGRFHPVDVWIFIRKGPS